MWVNWEGDCLGEKNGGLGIPSSFLRNLALLGKWWERFYDGEENDGL